MTSAIRRAEAGIPTVLTVEGEAGTGKTVLLDEIATRAVGFRLLAGEGLEIGEPAPFTLLAAWGVESTPRGALSSTLSAAQRLRQVLDDSAASRPVLVLIDDLQWVDPESVEALTGVLARGCGDRLLVCVASRPLAAETHPGWQRWATRRGRGLSLTMTGLDWPQARSLVAQARPEFAEPTVRQLWEHTSGNPLYLQALVTQYGPDDLHRMRELPAPAEFERLVTGRLRGMPAPCTRLVRAVAVLGTGWHTHADIAELAQVADPAAAAALLVDSGLLQLQSGAVTYARISHDLVRAAVYQDIPLPLRRDLHAKAAQIVTGSRRILDHRVAAAQEYDDELAAELESHAVQLHAARSHRMACGYLRSAGALSRSPRRRERLWLEALFERALCADRAVVHAELAEVEQASDTARATLVRATLAAFEKRNDTAVALIAPVLARPDAPIDPMTRYRLEAVLVWARITSEHLTPEITAGLDRLTASPVKDPVLARWLRYFAGHVAVRHTDGVSWSALAEIPDRPAAVAMDDTPLLALRGSLRANGGPQAAAIADLVEVVRRVQDGVSDFGDGSFHAYLARAYWFDGQWGLARVNMNVATELSQEHVHPAVAASAPLTEIGDGSLDRADALIDVGRGMLARAPSIEAVDLLTVTRVVRLHVDTASHRRAALFADLRETVESVADRSVGKSPMWLIHVALAAIWAGEVAAAEMCVAAVAHASFTGAWIAPSTRWVRGLIAEARGNGRLALDELRAAAEGARDNLPLYRAHVLVDLSRLAQQSRDVHAARDALEQAATIYRRLGATNYLGRVEGLPARPKVSGTEPAVTLTRREQDILALVMEGMSYAQIARQLFVTQSTVGYHLSNIYRKAAVSSRHELVEAVRRNRARVSPD